MLQLSSDSVALIDTSTVWHELTEEVVKRYPNTKVQLCHKANGVASYGTLNKQALQAFTHYAGLPVFEKSE